MFERNPRSRHRSDRFTLRADTQLVMSGEIRTVSIKPEHLLMLAGRLDDSPGFDTPRERFRRFLLERVTDVQFACALADEWQRSPGDQARRALQDAVVLLGRFLGLEPIF